MFSALKRLTKRGDEGKASFPSGVAVMNPNMQKKFSRGIQYNMKIVLKGDRNTGKSCLLARLQGGVHREEYIPTHEIQVACINWNYRGSDEVVKVEVWDIVDKAHRKRRRSNSLKVAHDDVQEEESDSDGVALDAEFLDVYKGTHGVIMLMDITKTWTWTYVERELPKIPHHIPVLIMANFRDMGSHRTIDEDRILAFIEHLDRPLGSAEINYTESSLKDGFGLRYIYRFLNMPFLILQRETLLRQLEANALEIEDFRESLQLNKENEDQNYDLFLEMLDQKKAEKTKSPKKEQESSPPPIVANGHSNGDHKPQDGSPSTVSPMQSPPPHEEEKQTGRKQKKKGKAASPAADITSQPTSPLTGVDKAIADFQIEEELDPSFLGDSTKKAERLKEDAAPDSSSDEDDDGNPLVEDYQDLSSDDEATIPSQVSGRIEPEVTQDTEYKDEESPDEESPPTNTTPAVQSGTQESSSEDEGQEYAIAGNIDIDSEPEEPNKATEIEKENDTSEEPDPTPIVGSSVDDSFTPELSLAGLDDFMAEQLGKNTKPNNEPKTPERTSEDVNEESGGKKKKKKKTKKEKTGDEETEKSKKKKKKSKDPNKKKKKSVDNAGSENADYELL